MWWARETAPMTQSELAAHLGISKRTVQNYEAGVGHPSEERLLLWANACDVDFSWLAGDFYSQPGDRPVVRRRVASTSGVRSPLTGELMGSTRPGRSPIPADHRLNRYRYQFTGNQLADVAQSVA
jgi:hypothetical protein